MKEIFFDNNNNFQWISITALVSIGTLVFSLLNFFIAKKTIKQQKDIEYWKQELSRKNNIKVEISEYLVLLKTMDQIIINFFNTRRELEENQNMLAKMIQDNADASVGIGHNPKDAIQKLNILLSEQILKWNENEEKIERKSEELLLLFRSNEQELPNIDELILSGPQILENISWVKRTNLENQMIYPLLDENSIINNIKQIRKLIRDYLN